MLLTDVGLFSHLIAALGFAGLAGAVLWQRRQTGASLWLATAAGVSAVWAGIFVFATRFGMPWANWLTGSETLRSAAWIAFLIAMLRQTWRLDERLRSSFVIAGGLGFIVTMQFALDMLGIANGLGPEHSLATQLFVVLRLTVAVSGLVLVHNLYVNSPDQTRGGVRILAIGIAGLFGYDLNFYTLQFLLPPASPDLFNIRGAVDVITVPLLLLSAREAWVARMQVSRQVLFHTLSFSIIGFYLIAMALLAYGLRLVGGDWGRLLQISFLFVTVIGAAFMLVSPRFRAGLRVQIAKNFFAYKYDYRQEWLRFIATVSRTEGGDDLNERVVQAVCTVVDSPGGALLVPGDDALEAVTLWNAVELAGVSMPLDSALVRFLGDRQRIVDFDELRAGKGDYDGATAPEWAARRVWLGVPLVHHERLAGLIVIERTLAPRELNWEDYDLLRTLGRQAASYIAESRVQAALDEAGKFDEFNRRFAFIMHDIKNLVSQLSLLSRNAERHADNPAFRADMVATLQKSVGKMNDLLARLAAAPATRGEVKVAPLDIAALLQQVVDAKRPAHGALALQLDAPPLTAVGDANRLEQLFAHLIQNAIDASAADAPITITGRRTKGHIEVAIADQGKGMSQRFIRNELFTPFKSTKPGGFGIGAFEAREIARSIGGRLDVVSAERRGTTFTLTLPLADDAAMREAAE